MAHGAPKRPSVSVVMAVRDAETTLSRAVESVLGQEFDDVQLVLVVLPSADGTRAMCDRIAGRDFRCDVIEAEDDDVAAACDLGMDAARGTYLIFMGQADWLGVQTLERLVALASAHDLELAAPVLSLDTTNTHGERVSHLDHIASGVFLSKQEVRDEARHFIEADGFGTLRGKLLKRTRVDALGLRLGLAQGSMDFLISYLEDIERLGIAQDAIYHVPQPTRIPAELRGNAFEHCERDHELLLGLAAHWGREDDDELMEAIHRRHLRRLIGCIDRVCAQRSVSSIERSARLRDMIGAPSTQRTIAALRNARHVHREFGLMFEYIARRNVWACCVGARLSMALPPLQTLRRNAAVL